MRSRAIYKQFIKFKYESILEYNSFVERNINDAVSDIEIQYEAFLKKNPMGIEKSKDEDYMDYFVTTLDEFAYENQKLSKDILQYHRKSILFHFYSLLEQEFYSASTIIGENSIPSIKDSTGNTIIKKFETYVNTKEPTLLVNIQDDLEYFNNIRLVRNIITHNNSIITQTHIHYDTINDFSINRFNMHFLGTNDSGERVYQIQLDNQEFTKEMFNKFEFFTNKIYQ
ncbi:hypothetical protein [Chryseobacterium sp.]|uniref:hypothetical protein n=1 Tax=Chryseobacterium sp. TaxID=1871047 RepID=UPI0024E1EE6E|nr:hypothetical protein [Chryseobacterium sp.]